MQCPVVSVRAGTQRGTFSTTIRSLLETAAEQLEQVVASPSEVGDDTAVHAVRKRGKEARALARLLGRTDGRRSHRFDATVAGPGRRRLVAP